MNKGMLSRFFLLSAQIILISACAKISAPAGGPRDKQPPVVIKCIPDNGATNFKGKSLSITFNEYVVLDNINEKFMVSPPMKKKPRVFLKGKSVNVTFEEDLKDSTTYTFYFQDGIKDLNEGNIFDNYKFVLSTGAVIDSLSVTGNVYNSLNLEVPEKTLVLMYRELADSAVVRHIPDYISRVDQDGYFRIDNVRAGNYRLYALKDDDNSKNYNNAGEEFAFMNSPVAITAEKNFLPEVIVKDTAKVKEAASKITKPTLLQGEYQLILFTALRKDHYLKESNRILKYQMIYILSLPPDSMKFEFSIPGTNDSAFFIERSRNNDTLKVWLTDSTLYSQQQITTLVKYPFTDTLGMLNYKEDTILMRFLAPRAPRGTKVKKSTFDVDANILKGSLKPGQSIVFRSQTPLRQPDTSRIRLYELTEGEKTEIPFNLISDSTNSCNYYLTAKFLQGKKYLFIADSASFGNIYDEYSDSTGIKFTFRDAESFSKLTLNIRNYEGNCIIQLLDKTEKLVSEEHINKEGMLVFSLLEPGFYRARAIFDLNGDGIWSTGDFTSGLQPEPVSYYPGEIEIKTGWELEQEWDIRTQNVKDQKLREKKKAKTR